MQNCGSHTVKTNVYLYSRWLNHSTEHLLKTRIQIATQDRPSICPFTEVNSTQTALLTHFGWPHKTENTDKIIIHNPQVENGMLYDVTLKK